jgi:glycine oxidase
VERINIAGAGIIGLASAWRLAQRGAAVTIFDAREAAREASWAGAGMLAPGGEFSEPSELARLSLHSLALYPDFVRELVEESGVSIDLRASGAIEVAFSDAEAEALKSRAATQGEFGIRSEEFTQDGRPARFYPDDAIVDPRDVTRALLAACRRRNVNLREAEPVQQVQPDGTVITGSGTYSAHAVLVAAGAWSSMLVEGVPKVVPVRGHLVSWKLEPGLLGPILRHGSTYLLQRTCGVLVAGTTKEHVGFDRSLDENAVADIVRRVEELLPVLSQRPPDERWLGFRPFVQGEAPVVNRVGESRVWGAFGHYRNGILLAPETAERVSAMLT